MFRIIIVDDEPDVSDSISFMIRQLCSTTCQVVGMAIDGLAGIRLIQNLKPDIVITDIHMPQCDGLEMIRKLRGSGLDPACIVISAYEDFESAKQAVQLGVYGFLSKPVAETELIDTLSRVCDILAKKRKEQEDIERMRSSLLNLGLTNFLMNAGYVDICKLKEVCGAFDVLPGNCSGYVCWIVMASDETVAYLNSSYFSFYPSLMKSLSVKMMPDFTVFITALPAETDIRMILNSLDKMRNALFVSHIPCCIGVGQPVSSFEELPASFRIAAEALNYRVLDNNNQIITYRDVENYKINPDILSAQDIILLEECFDRLDDEDGIASVRRIFDQLRDRKDLRLEELRLVALIIVQYGFRRALVTGLRPNMELRTLQNWLEYLNSINDIDTLEDWVIESMRRLRGIILTSPQNEDKSDVIENAKQYIRQNFTQPITLNDISEKFYINPYYFSQLFKKRTGIRYQDYVTDLRMERAKTLLQDTNMKISDIRSSVGYSDVSHFNRLFERSTGLTPSAYRKQHRVKD